MLIREARDLMHLPVLRPLAPSPTRFSGELATLFEEFIESNLPAPDVVARFHAELAAYVRDPSALLLVRYVRGMERGMEYATADGTRLKATDNSPAWWVHFALLQDGRISPGSFARVIATMPAHMFDVGRSMPGSASASGWHVAHLFSVKDGRTAFGAWRRPDAVGRFVRSIHPCNHFLLPKTDWERWGADARVLAFVAERYASRYSDVWEEFVRLARADPSALGRVTGPIPVSIPAEDATTHTQATEPVPPPPSSPGRDRGRVCASYRATRLLFKRDVIDRLRPGDAFRVLTPIGAFEMTRAEFERAFPNVCRSASYRERGLYHYPVVPRAALPFLLPPEPADRSGAG
jgi:hypothetical protein